LFSFRRFEFNDLDFGSNTQVTSLKRRTDSFLLHNLTGRLVVIVRLFYHIVNGVIYDPISFPRNGFLYMGFLVILLNEAVYKIKK
jgi:hypothetical protein